jgi:hypothetical protein
MASELPVQELALALALPSWALLAQEEPVLACLPPGQEPALPSAEPQAQVQAKRLGAQARLAPRAAQAAEDLPKESWDPSAKARREAEAQEPWG